MAIVKMSRFNLTIFESDKDTLLRNLQAFGDVDFANLNVSPTFIVEAEAEAHMSGVDIAENEELAATREEMELYKLEGVNSDFQGETLASLQEYSRKIKWCVETLESAEPSAKGLSAFNNALPEISYENLEAKAAELDLAAVYAKVRNIKRDIQNFKEENDLARVENRVLLTYQKLDVPFNKVGATANTEVLFGSYPKRWREPFESGLDKLEYTYYEVLSVDDKNVNVFMIYDRSEAEAVAEILRVNAFTQESFDFEGTAAEKIADNKERIKERERGLEEQNAELTVLADQYLDDFRILYESIENNIVRQTARENFLKTERTVMIEGYVPTENEADLARIVETSCQNTFNLSVETVERNDQRVIDVPVKLRNNGLVRPFESVVSTYAVPRYDELDPTPIMMPWYSVIFGMMMGDLGYGLVILILTTIGLKAFKLKESTRGFLRFFQILSIPTIIAGACFGSFFAISFPSLIDPTVEYMTFIIFSVAFGFVMMMLGLGVKAYMMIRDGNILGAIYDVFFWYMIIGGAALLLLKMMGVLSATAGTIGMWVMIVGLIGVFLFSARDENGILPRLGWGLYNVYGVSSWIGDFVSYTRIAALVLSGAFIGYAVNLIAGTLMGSIVGFIIAIIVMVVFHAFNIFLSGLSGYVHTMRLAYVEYFGKFYEGGGRMFKRFRSPSVYMDVK
ncbi:MAG: V-type ATP synthase subunit I [Fastidiosipilaceae bacterium]|jgi:V/A-type H+-transporting ATPase subunit I